tara:strand:+ start:865 stop:1188 length:324 start_codon:yes stop_codon:yes gene_type:complete
MRTNEEYRQLQAENDALKAQNKVLCDFHWEGLEPFDMDTPDNYNDRLIVALKKYPAQCLAQVKYDAIIEAVGATQDWHFDRGEPLEYCSPSKLAEYAANLLTKQGQS